MNIDADGNFIKTTLNEKGTTIIWTWDAEKNAWYTPFFKGFIWDRATEDNKYFSDQLHMSVLIDESIKGFPTITHHDNIDPPNTKNWTSLFQNQLFL